MLLHGINDNILIPNLYYLGVYQDEAKILELYKEINIFWVGIKQTKTDKTAVHVSPTTLGIKIYIQLNAQLNGCWV